MTPLQAILACRQCRPSPYQTIGDQNSAVEESAGNFGGWEIGWTMERVLFHPRRVAGWALPPRAQNAANDLDRAQSHRVDVTFGVALPLGSPMLYAILFTSASGR